MILESLDDGEKYIFRFANNGRKPPRKINEGGGLSSVRKKSGANRRKHENIDFRNFCS